jgi:hypothetical protein
LPAFTSSRSVSCSGGDDEVQWRSNDHIELLKASAAADELALVQLIVVEECCKVGAEARSEVPVFTQLSVIATTPLLRQWPS